MNVDCKNNDCDRWLEQFHLEMTERGYTKHKGGYGGERFAYWKTFNGNYQVGLLIFDYRKYLDRDPDADKIGIQYECMLLNFDDRLDMSFNKDKATVEEFEKMSEKFYNTFR